MKNKLPVLSFFLTLCLSFVPSCVSYADESAANHAGHENWPFEIKTQHKPGTYWWAPGSAWDIESIDWNLKKLKEGGIGTLHIVPIYGAKGYEDRYIQFLSKKWIDSLNAIVEKAGSLGINVDMTTGTGWCFGGPDLSDNEYDLMARWDDGKMLVRGSRMVKRAAPGGEGHMLNPFSSRAMRSYLNRFDNALAECEHLPRAQYHDSFEYSANWCIDAPEEFKKRRGYDLHDHLATLFSDGDSSETTARIKYDYRLTMNELHQEYIQTWADWARSKGMITRNQGHGSPTNLLDTYAITDVPETEMFGSPEFPIPGFRHEEQFCRPGDSDHRICRMASSAAHVAHKPGSQLVSSESCTWMREHWHGTLGQIKLEMDLFFLAGINHVFYHGSCYSPKDIPWPGWFFYASTKADWRNSIWHDMPLLNDYIARCQSVLQAGQPANDILVYWPIHDLWMDPEGLLKNLTVHSHGWMDNTSLGNMANQLDAKGYSFDFISDQMLDSIEFKRGEFIAPGGTYKAIVVPESKYMPAKTLKTLADLASQKGAVVLFEKALPADVPGYGDLKKRREDFIKEKERFGKAAVTDDVIESLSRAGILRETITDCGLRYIRRKIEDSYWYFIANHTAREWSGWLEPAVPFSSAILHDPMTGDAAQLLVKKTKFYIDIAPGESFIIQTSPAKQNIKPYISMKPVDDPIELKGKWKIEFIEGEPDLPESYTTESLESWTSAPDEKAQRFAGTARYTLTFNFPELGAADDYLLDLGDVRESARVKINGKQAAALFALPMRSRVGRYLKEGRNTIEIEVTNLSANRIRDLDIRKVDWKILRDINIVTPQYRPFDASVWPLQPSGLLGPVRLLPMKKQDVM